MRHKWYIIIFLSTLSTMAEGQNFVYPEGNFITTRFKLPGGYRRLKERDQTTFFAFLQNLPLLPHGTPVAYSGTEPAKPQSGPRPVALIDMILDDENLQREPQSLMRLWAEYLFELQKFEEITFHIRNGRVIAYDKWKEGVKGVVDGTAYWTKTPKDLNAYATFRRYLSFVFRHSDFATLQSDLRPADDLTPGTVLLTRKDGRHKAVMVLDVAVNDQGEQLLILAGGGNPAQSIQVLLNNADGRTPAQPGNLGPWFRVEQDGSIRTGEAVFSIHSDLYHF